MSTAFYWFKNYETIEENYGMCGTFYNINFLDGGETSHSVGNYLPIQKLLRENFDTQIPYISTSMVDTDNIEKYLDTRLINPKDMLYMMEFLLRKYTNEELSDLQDRVELFRDLSKEGYYIAYDSF